jgi:sialate O-acetylesterase
MHWRSLAVASLLLVVVVTARADIRVNALISDNAVLQRDVPLKIWGTADVGEDFTPAIEGPNAPRISTIQYPNADGTWELTLPPLRVGGPYTLTFKSVKSEVKISNILVGEVWLCAGEANMETPLAQTRDYQKSGINANNPNVRLLNIPHHTSGVASSEGSWRWKECSPQSAADFSAVAFHFGERLQKSLNVPVGLIQATWASTPGESWISREALLKKPELQYLTDTRKQDYENYVAECERYLNYLERYRTDGWKHLAEGKELPCPLPPPLHPTRNPQIAGSIFDGMIAPLTKFAIRGVAWYQGESNVSRAFNYRTLFAALIEDWRARWKNRDMPFLFVQLPPDRASADDQQSNSLSELRDSQFQVHTKLKKTAMIVVSDMNDGGDGRPPKMEPVGARMALAARAIANDESVQYSGPLFKSQTIEGDRIILSFQHVGSGLMAHEREVAGFCIADKNRKFVPARAEIWGDTVVVSSSLVKEPIAVRYDWSERPTGNLRNRDGLPASPFRTDDFPLSTQPKDSNRIP